MDASGEIWLQVAVPALLLVIMTSMGLELTPADFRRVVRLPRAVGVGLFGQLIVLPCLGLAFATALELPTALALGVVIITACPGGAPSNIFSYLARANIALSVTLTALSSLLTLLTIPLWVNLGLRMFSEGGAVTRLPLGPTFAQLFVLTAVPVGTGMWLRSRAPTWAARARPALRRAMTALFVVAMILVVATQWETIRRDMATAAWSAIGLVSLALGLGYALARTARLPETDAFTVSIEIGLQNGSLATLIAVNLLDRPDLVVFPGAYAILAMGPVGAWSLAFRHRTRSAHGAARTST